MNGPSFHIFNIENSEWLQDDERLWGTFENVASFATYELAHHVAKRESKAMSTERGIVVLANFGEVSTHVQL